MYSPTNGSDDHNKPPNVKWTREYEMLLVEWADIAQCYKWLNNTSQIYYAYYNMWFTIPAIILSTVSGTASFGTNNLPEIYRSTAPLIIGTINILVGILTTIQHYLKISEYNEAYRVAELSWDKFARNIRIEISKAPEDRMDVLQFIKIARNEYDRLMETTPNILTFVINKFIDTFDGEPGSDEKKLFDKVRKPDICNIIVSSEVYLYGNKTNQPNVIPNKNNKSTTNNRFFNTYNHQYRNSNSSSNDKNEENNIHFRNSNSSNDEENNLYSKNPNSSSTTNNDKDEENQNINSSPTDNHKDEENIRIYKRV